MVGGGEQYAAAFKRGAKKKEKEKRQEGKKRRLPKSSFQLLEIALIVNEILKSQAGY